MRIKKIHHHAKIQLNNFKNEGEISDLEILLVMKNLVTLQKSFGMVSRGYTPILVKISITVRQIYRPVPPEEFWANPFRLSLVHDETLQNHVTSQVFS